jgi:hypothetical protein
VATAGFDPLRDEGELYAAALRNAGTVTEVRRYGSLLHAIANFDALGGNSVVALTEITSAIKAHLSYQRWPIEITGDQLMLNMVLRRRFQPVDSKRAAPPKALRMGNGADLVSQALQRFCENQSGMVYISPVVRGTTATSNRSTSVYGRSASPATIEPPCSRSWVVIGDLKHKHNYPAQRRRLGLRCELVH